MKPQRRLMGLALATAVLVLGAAASAEEFAPKGAGFKIDLPGKPKEDKKQIPTPVGNLELVIYQAKSDNGLEYVVVYNDYPANVVKATTADGLLDGAKNGVVAGTGGKLVNEKKITLGTFPGRELLIQPPGDKGILRSQIFMVNNRLYQVMIVGPEDTVKGAGGDTYFKSFQVDAK